jgi:RimJ/RimL family protein N-acetyltransferase
MLDDRRTERLLLRQWRPADREPFAAMNADAAVMAHFPAPLTRDQSDQLVEAIEAAWARDGFGLWAVEVDGAAPFVGFVGLAVPGFEAPFTPAVEIGWRLDRRHWGRGYATEAGHSVLAAAFGELGLDEVVSFTSLENVRSQRVMARLGLHHDPADDFDNPRMPAGHRLVRHVLYRVTRADWERATG